LIRAGVSQKVAMELTGHLTPSVFDRYNITDDRDRRDAVAKLAAAAAPSRLPHRNRPSSGTKASVRVTAPFRRSRGRNNHDFNREFRPFLAEISLQSTRVLQPMVGVVDKAHQRLAVRMLGIVRDVEA